MPISLSVANAAIMATHWEDAEKGKMLAYVGKLQKDNKLQDVNADPSYPSEVIAEALLATMMQEAAAASAASGAGVQLLQLLPIQAMSYTQLANQWSSVQGVTSTLDSLIGVVDGDAFLQCWQENFRRLEALKLYVPLCTSETSGNVSYVAGGGMLEAISRVLTTQPGSDCGKAQVFFNQAGKDKTRPDVAWCGLSNDVEILPADMYKHLKLVLEYKTNVAMHTQPAITTGTGQLISRAGAALMEQNLSSFTLPGAVLDNRAMVPVIVTTSTSMNRSLKMVNAKLLLFQDNAKTDSSGAHLVATKSPAFKELVHLCWVAAREQLMRAAADPSNLACLEDGSCVAVLSTDKARDKGMGREPACYRVLRKLAPPSASGCAYLAVPCQAGSSAPPDGAAGPQLVLKVAPAPELASQARQLCLPLELWNQVPREIQALSLLERHAVESLPQLVNHGLLDVGCAAAGRGLQGAAVVVTELLGEALVQRGQMQQTLLPVAEAERLMWDIFEALAVLQALGLQHCDVAPRNLGKRITASGASKYYLFDFGSAMTAAELAAGLVLRQPCSLLFSAMEVLLGATPGPLADAVALIFSGLALAGVALPWSGPAAAGNDLACVGLRVDFMADPARQLPAWAHLFSPELRQLSEDVMHCALQGEGHDTWLADRLARTSRGASSGNPSPSPELDRAPDYSAQVSHNGPILEPVRQEGIMCS